MTMRVSCGFILLFLTATVWAQPHEGPDTLWTRFLPGAGDVDIENLLLLPDQSLVVGGQSGDLSWSDFALDHFDSAGLLLRQQRFNWDGEGGEWGGILCPTTD